VARTRQAFDRDTPDDRILEERIRAELGFLVSHPHAITVSAERGCATLSGLILEDEVKPLIRGVTRVRGVKEVRNRLQPHEHADDIPSLQGGERKPAGRRFALRQQYWSPGPRLLTGAAGATLAMYGKRRRGLAGAGLRAVGLGLFARSATNQPLRRLTGVGAGRRAIDIRKTINVAAPIEQVFAFWTDYENFPRFMTHVREVHRADGAGRAEGAAEEERSHWRVEGPGGIGLRYDAVVTKKEPPEWFAWRSERSTLLRHAGIVHLAPTASGGTRIEVRLSYNPPAGALGHVVAHILGADPKRQMDDDLLRMKTLLETGRPPHDAAQPGGEQLVRH
jgi:uncharacterized membrane protein